MSEKRIFWNQGLFLTPQHLQQADDYHQRGLRNAIAQAHRWYWGMADLQISTEGLEHGRIDVQRISWITREGIHLRGGGEVPDGNLRLAPRDFVAIAEELGAGKTFSAYASLAPADSAQRNYTDAPPDGKGLLPRFRVTSQDVHDLFEPTEHDPVQITRMEHQARIWFDVEDGFENLGDSHEVVKLAELRVLADGAEPAVGFVPPSVCVSADPILKAKVNRARDRIVQRADGFAREKRERGVHAMAGSQADITRLMMLTTLNRFGAALHHESDHGASHPAAIYGLLREAIGELSAYSDVCNFLGAPYGDDSGELPAYDHERIGPIYDAALDRLTRVLDGMVIGPEMLIDLEFDPEDRLYKAALEPKFFEGHRQLYYLIIDSPSKDGDEISKYLNEVGKLRERSRIEEAVQKNLTGVPVVWETQPPETLPRRGNRYSYFRVDPQSRGGEDWSHVEESGNIALYSPDLGPEETRVMIAKTSMGDR